ncbi:uncharacterized protein K460DRAFT_400232 [Cucurbitaria berberidis CBS 394.84]|uniref:Uncharacterized protein n=1 Tax=Cucurbitaria berberidis CBS 394.84 TaxID=1168544 RepID=A0A9P4GRV9_9PLEO|nr:uncharacterized protein K460DRAFT_400232 [Cucurbitaria berberidis CBS 394.84]KAF1850149.1 hypothetical protein K460DRAFT_400232 [Cucurbitaria berberidis CBS 394.84]
MLIQSRIDRATYLTVSSPAAKTTANGYVRVVPSLNVAHDNLAREDTSSKFPTAALPAFSATFHSTGIQTQPLCDGDQFIEIFGYDPTRDDLKRRIGTAAIGRYKTEGEVKPHELVYGAAFSVAHVPRQKALYVNAGFQTTDFAESNKALARAKVKASMVAKKYRRVAEAAGYRVWAESKDERVIHSEQYAVKIELDAEGNAFDADITGHLLPNIYGVEIESALDCSGSIHNPTHTNTHKVFSQRDTAIDLEILRPIPALEPSTRESDPDPEPIEDYGYEISLRGEDSDMIFEKDAQEKAVKPENPSGTVNSPIHTQTDVSVPPKSSLVSPSYKIDRKASKASRLQKQRPGRSLQISTSRKIGESPTVESSIPTGEDNDRKQHGSLRDTPQRTGAKHSSRARKGQVGPLSELRSEDVPRSPKVHRTIDQPPRSSTISELALSTPGRKPPGRVPNNKPRKIRSTIREEDDIASKETKGADGPNSPPKANQVSVDLVLDHEVRHDQEKLARKIQANIGGLEESWKSTSNQKSKGNIKDTARLQTSTTQMHDPQTDVNAEDQHDLFTRAREIEDRRRKLAYAVVEQKEMNDVVHRQSYTPKGVVVQDAKPPRIEPIDEMMRARRAEERRRELHHANMSSRKLSRHIQKRSVDKTERSVSNDEERREEGIIANRKVAAPQPRRVVREEIKRYDPRDRVKKIREAESFYSDTAVKDRVNPEGDSTRERDDGNRKRRKR